MKKILSLSLVLGLSLLSMGEIRADAQEKIAIVQQNPQKSGKAIVEKIRKDYEKGQYETFLKKLHDEYQRAGKSGLFRGIVDQKKKVVAQRTKEADRHTRWAETKAKLDQERNEKLKEVFQASPDLEVSQRVQSMLAFALAEEEQLALKTLRELEEKVIGEGQNFEENKLIAIATEYELKRLLLDSAGIKKAEDLPAQNEKLFALSLEKMHKMQKAAENFKETKWQALLRKAESSFVAHKAFEADLGYLKSLAKATPSNPTEEKVKAIMADYLAQSEQHYQTIFGKK